MCLYLSQKDKLYIIETKKICHACKVLVKNLCPRSLFNVATEEQSGTCPFNLLLKRNGTMIV